MFFDGGDVIVDFEVDGDGFSEPGAPLFGGRDGELEEDWQRDLAKLQGSRATVLHELVDKARGALELLFYRGDARHWRVGALEQLDVRADDAERISDLVRDGRGEGAELREALGLIGALFVNDERFGQPLCGRALGKEPRGEPVKDDATERLEGDGSHAQQEERADPVGSAQAGARTRNHRDHTEQKPGPDERRERGVEQTVLEELSLLWRL